MSAASRLRARPPHRTRLGGRVSGCSRRDPPNFRADTDNAISSREAPRRSTPKGIGAIFLNPNVLLTASNRHANRHPSFRPRHAIWRTKMFDILLPAARRIAAVALMLATGCAVAQAPSKTLPDTPLGALGGALLRHVNEDSPEQIRRWVGTVLSPSMPAMEQETFTRLLAATAATDTHVELVDVRRGPPPDGLVLTVRDPATNRYALFVVSGDPQHPDRLGFADLVGMDDPALYADWRGKDAVSRERIVELAKTALETLVRDSDFSGCVTASDGSEIFIDECRGLAERNFGVRNDTRTKFRVGSINKMFTSVAIAQLVEAGKLKWDTTLAQALPDYPDRDAARRITIWQMLHHTSGLGDFLVPEFFANREKFVEAADYIDLIARQPKVGAPGSDWNYSNAGYVLLGRIIEQASGQNYFDYIERHVFAPAGMRDSGFDALDEVVPGLSVGYFVDSPFSTQWKAAWMKLPYKGGPAGNAYSTNGDLLRFGHALRAGKLVKSATLAKMFDGAIPAGPGAYAAGFGERLSNGRRIRGHGGGIEGVSANLAIVWETGATVAVTSNQGASNTAIMLAERIADLLAKAPVPQAR
jgi:D-alanyl-D-alanine carboxypeptidase